MALVIPDEAEEKILETITGLNLYINLFRTDLTPSESTLYIHMYPGGLPVALGPWVINTVSGVTTATHGAVNIYLIEEYLPMTIYGWYVYDDDDKKLIMVERLATPLNFSSIGGVVQVEPKLTAE